MTLEVKLDTTQRAIVRALKPGTICTSVIGRGGGKTFLGGFLIHLLALQQKRHIGLILPELKQARAAYWIPYLFDQYANDLRDEIAGPPNRSNLSVTYRNGSRLSTWGAENAHSIRSQRFDVLIQDETDKIDPVIEASVLEPTFSRSGRNAIWYRCGTPLRGRRGTLYAGWKAARDGLPGHVAFKVPSSQSRWVDQQWLARVKAKIDPRIYRREYDVDFDASEGLVYDLFDEDFHVRPFPKEACWSDILIGCDHGYEDPGVILLIGIQGHGQDAVAWVLDEVYEQHKTEDWWCEKLRVWMGEFPGAFFYPDPSQPARIEAYRKKAGVRPRGRHADNTVDNSIQDGVTAVAHRLMRFTPGQDEHGNDRLEEARLYVDPRCVNTIREFGVYKRKPESMANQDDVVVYTDDIVDKDNHAMDALRYAIFNYFGPVR